MGGLLSEMHANAKKVMNNSYSPYSEYRVGACIKGADDELYCGTNVENCSYGLCICAEASAITAMVSGGCREIKAILVIASGEKLCTPCGACRQRIAEFAGKETAVHLANHAGIQKTLNLSELLPMAFSPKFLDEEH